MASYHLPGLVALLLLAWPLAAKAGRPADSVDSFISKLPIVKAGNGIPPSNMSTDSSRAVQSRMNLAQMLGATGAAIAAELTGCVYGRYCGSKCRAKPYYGRPSGLDGACYDHDLCLDNRNKPYARTECYAPGLQGMKCECDRNLANAALRVYNSGKKCSWWQLWCWESTESMASWAVHKAMKQRLYCGSC